MAKNPFKNTVVLDFDGSVPPFVPIERVDLASEEERVRYYAAKSRLTALEGRIKDVIARKKVFIIGSGDLHHISYLLIKNTPVKKLQVIVFDNHPDNMVFPAAVHCGSWVHHAARLPNVHSVSVFGIASKDLHGIDIVQNRFSSVRSGRVRYYCAAPVPGLAARLGGGGIVDLSRPEKDIKDVLLEAVKKTGLPVYLSIDKDVVRRADLRTTWDQGVLSEAKLLECVESIAPYVVAADITGDISAGRYKNPVKKIMRWIDGGDVPVPDLERERLRHVELNYKILRLLKGISA